MKTIRRKVFETNSSSTHCFSFNDVKGTRRDETIIPDENGVIDLKPTATNSASGKALLMLEAAIIFGQLERVLEIIKQYTGASSITRDGKPFEVRDDNDLNAICDKLYENPSKISDILFSEEYEYIHYEIGCLFDWGGRDENWELSDELKMVIKTLRDSEKILDFIFCSANGLSIISYSDY